MYGRFDFRMSVQTVLPPDFATSEAFRRTAEGLRDLGLWGVELNVADLNDPRTASVEALRDYLGELGLELSMFASGLTAKRLGVSLSTTDAGARAEALRAARAMVDWVAAGRGQRDEARRAGIIIGFLKGGIATDPEAARVSLLDSLRELAPYAAERMVPLIIEATNRYETSVVNTLADGVRLIDELGLDPAAAASVEILPDTFHMNIEEGNLREALAGAFGHYSSFHLSDNNRLFPGFGAIDFPRILGILRELGYAGRFAIEGNVEKDLLSDLRQSLDYLAPIMT